MRAQLERHAQCEFLSAKLARSVAAADGTALDRRRVGNFLAHGDERELSPLRAGERPAPSPPAVAEAKPG